MLVAKIRQYIFVGYRYGEFGYRCYHLVAEKLVRSCDMDFVKDQIIEDINKP